MGRVGGSMPCVNVRGQLCGLTSSTSLWFLGIDLMLAGLCVKYLIVFCCLRQDLYCVALAVLELGWSGPCKHLILYLCLLSHLEVPHPTPTPSFSFSFFED